MAEKNIIEYYFWFHNSITQKSKTLIQSHEMLWKSVCVMCIYLKCQNVMYIFNTKVKISFRNSISANFFSLECCYCVCSVHFALLFPLIRSPAFPSFNLLQLLCFRTKCNFIFIKIPFSFSLVDAFLCQFLLLHCTIFYFFYFRLDYCFGMFFYVFCIVEWF